MNKAWSNPDIIERLMNIINTKLAPVLGIFGENKTIQSLILGMVGVAPVTFLGAIFLLLQIMATYVPAMMPYSPQILNGFFLTLNMLGFYIAVSIAINYAQLFNLNQLTAAIISIMAYLTINMQVDAGMISIDHFGSTGIFPAVIVTLLGMRSYRFMHDKEITIKMPPSVPPMISEMFAALIPAIVIVLITWFIRNILAFEITPFLANLMAPLFKGADNVFVVTLRMLLGMVFWSVGLQGDAMFQGVTGPFLTTWQTANANAAVAGQPLPYIWVGAFERMVLWVPSVWGLMFWMYLSKVKSFRSLAIATTPAAIFTIIEPIVFGLPVAFNAFLIIPFVLSTTLATIVSYLTIQAGIFARFYVGLPWFTPPPIIAVGDSGGHWENLILLLINFTIGVLLYWPFFKAYEKKVMEEEATAETRLESEK